MQRAYTSTAVGRAQLVLGLVLAAGIGVVTLLAGAPAWVTAVGTVVVALAALHLSVVRLSIGAGRIVVGQGPWNRGARVIPAESVVSAAGETLRWPQVFGLGERFHRKTERLTVRPGATLSLQLTSGEHLRISTQDPGAALALLDARESENPDVSKHPSRSWFGPKRVGYGLRPQTWQGWAVTVAVIALIVTIALISKH